MLTVASFELMFKAGELAPLCIHAAALLPQPAAKLKQQETKHQQNGSSVQEQILRALWHHMGCTCRPTAVTTTTPRSQHLHFHRAKTNKQKQTNKKAQQIKAPSSVCGTEPRGHRLPMTSAFVPQCPLWHLASTDPLESLSNFAWCGCWIHWDKWWDKWIIFAPQGNSVTDVCGCLWLLAGTVKKKYSQIEIYYS